MPFIDTCDESDALPYYYNVVNAVGKNCPNRNDDVKLVQYLLQLFYSNSGFTPPKGMMRVDGICGPVTKNWITRFQLDVKSFGSPILVDGRIDRARDHHLMGAVSHTGYTILWLNSYVAGWAQEEWAAIPGMIPMQDAGSVPAPSNDYVSDGPAVQSTSPGGFPGHTPTSPSYQTTSYR